VKRAFGISIGLREKWTLLRDRPLRRERRDAQSTILGEKNKDDDGTLWPARTLSGNRSGREAFRREQLKSNHR
jgi:hypothetical protein